MATLIDENTGTPLKWIIGILATIVLTAGGAVAGRLSAHEDAISALRLQTVPIGTLGTAATANAEALQRHELRIQRVEDSHAAIAKALDKMGETQAKQDEKLDTILLRGRSR